MNTRFWTDKDVTRSKEFIHAIEQRLKTRRIFQNLECFVGGRVYVKMEMERPCSSSVKFNAACSYSTDTCTKIMKVRVKVSKLPQTLISASSSFTRHRNSRDDDERLHLAADLKKAHNHIQRHI
ncbi:hypothetical protein Tco_1514668 [Tanacetum coccineum]